MAMHSASFAAGGEGESSDSDVIVTHADEGVRHEPAFKKLKVEPGVKLELDVKTEPTNSSRLRPSVASSGLSDDEDVDAIAEDAEVPAEEAAAVQAAPSSARPTPRPRLPAYAGVGPRAGEHVLSIFSNARNLAMLAVEPHISRPDTFVVLQKLDRCPEPRPSTYPIPLTVGIGSTADLLPALPEAHTADVRRDLGLLEQPAALEGPVHCPVPTDLPPYFMPPNAYAALLSKNTPLLHVSTEGSAIVRGYLEHMMELGAARHKKSVVSRPGAANKSWAHLAADLLPAATDEIILLPGDTFEYINKAILQGTTP
jgi:hypothetical protein